MAGCAEALENSYVRISEDKMEAWLYLCEPEDGDCFTKDELVAYLAEYGVKGGLILSNISAIAKKGIYGREIRVAVGREKIEGVDGHYEFYFSPEKIAKTPLVREDGSVDYTAMKSLQTVKKGEKIALYVPAVFGHDGYSVMGQEMRAKYARELPPLGGRSAVHAKDNPNLYLAALDGKIQIQDNKIDIQSVHEIREDVDLLTGHIEFYGDIIIHGNVSAGVTIRAGRNLIIRGTVEACTLYAGGDIVLQRGMQGSEKGKVKAKGSVFADFLEYSNVFAGKDIQSNSIMNSVVSAGERILITGRKGKIIGGYSHAVISIDASSLGNPTEIKTVVHAGFTEREFNRISELNKKELELKMDVSKLTSEISSLKRHIATGIPRVMEVKIAECVKGRENAKEELEKLKQERMELTEAISKGHNSRITSKGRIERGVVICLENQKMPLERSNSFIQYTVVNGKINGKVIAL